ncbi:MAG: hypothetical protein LIP10_01900 [Clostridiales bacterium]|nr:hypothetical protein [Clostridiales bacterium]
MVIDANLYWIPEQIFSDEALMKQFLSEVPERYDWHGHYEEVPGTSRKRQVVLEKPAGSPNLNYVQGDYVLENMLKDLDEAGVEKAILKVPGLP